MVPSEYIKARLGEPVSGMGGTATLATTIMSLDPHTPQFWTLVLVSVLQILLPETRKL